MSGNVVCDLSVSADGFVTGAGQTREKPFGDGPVDQLHTWMFEAAEENQPELDLMGSPKAYIMGRNMFGPDRGDWDLDWTGWWGDEPPYHAPVFVLAHRSREPLEKIGTTFTFVTDGIESALARARAAAGDGDVAISGGASTVNQYLRAGLIDELRLHVAPVVIGAGERLWDGVPAGPIELVSARATTYATHVTYRFGGGRGA